MIPNVLVMKSVARNEIESLESHIKKIISIEMVEDIFKMKSLKQILLNSEKIDLKYY